MKRLLAILGICALLAYFVWRCETAIQNTSPTFDEGIHLASGVCYWRTGAFHVNRETPPLMKLLWAAPVILVDGPEFDFNPYLNGDQWRMADAFMYESSASPESMLQHARRINVAVGALLILLIGLWAWRAWGTLAGVAASAFAAFDPNLIAHSSLLGTDVPLTLFCTFAAYCLWEYVERPRRLWFVLAGVSLGFALATKYSAGAMVISLFVGAAIFVNEGGTFALPGVSAGTSRWKRLFSAFVRLGLIAALALLPAYFVIHVLEWPAGLRKQIGRHESVEPRYFLSGEVSTSGWWRYFTTVIACKTPLGALTLAFLSLFTLRQPLNRNGMFMIFPCMIYVGLMSLTRLNLGIRVILPAYVLVWLLAGRVASLGRWGILLVVPAVALPTLLDTPGSELSYFLERSRGHQYLGDSNLDWGQGLKSLHQFLDENGNPVIYLSYFGTARPEAFGVRYERLPGWGAVHPPPRDRVDPAGRVFVAVSVTNLQGIYLRDSKMFDWLMDRTPVSQTDGSIWVFDLTGDADACQRIRAIADDS